MFLDGGLMTRDEFGDVEAHRKFVVPQGSHSGVYFRARYDVEMLKRYAALSAHATTG